jgi:MFS family permease
MATEKQSTAAKPPRRGTTVFLMFIFMLLHQTDKYLISPLTTPIMDEFGINEAQMGAVFTGAILVGVVFYPLWGYLFDRYVRPKILALAALIWGATTWLSAIAPTFGAFVATRASTGIDDASYPGIYSMVSDLYPPHRRGRIIGVLQLSMILGGLAGMGLAVGLKDTIGWRGVFYITGSLGVVVALVFFFLVRDAPRGQTEPELAGLADTGVYRFDWKVAGKLLRRPTMLLVFLQQFIYVFPFMGITYWYFRYMEVERGYPDGQVMMVMSVFSLAGALGNVLSGALGDWAFRRNPRGRMFVAIGGVIMLTTFFTSALRVPPENFTLFFVLQTIGSLFVPFVYPNIVSTIQDTAEPEVRSTAHAMMGIAEMGASALAPLVMGLIAVEASLQQAMLTITTIGWIAGGLFLVAIAAILPRDVAALRQLMRERAEAQRT